METILKQKDLEEIYVKILKIIKENPSESLEVT